MSKRFYLVLLTLVLALSVTGLTALAKDQALFACIAEPMSASDQAVFDKLEAMGFDVTAIDHASASDEDPANYALLVISSSCSSVNLNSLPEYMETKTPVLSWEHALMDELKTAPTNGPVDGVENPSFTIEKASHPIAAGFSGSVLMFEGTFQLHSGEAEAGTIVAVLDGAEEKVGILAVEKGEKLADESPAPGRRVHFTAGDVLFESITADGWKLFEQSIKWLVRK